MTAWQKCLPTASKPDHNAVSIERSLSASEASFHAANTSRELVTAARFLSVGFTISISMWPACPPSWWRGGTKNNYRPIYSRDADGRKRRGRHRLTSRFRPVSRSVPRRTQPSVRRIVCSLSLRLIACWGHQERPDKLRKVNCGRSACQAAPRSSPTCVMRVLKRACIDADRYHWGLAREDIDIYAIQSRESPGLFFSYCF